MEEKKQPKFTHETFKDARHWVFDMYLRQECWFTFKFFKTAEGKFYTRIGNEAKPYSETDVEVADFRPRDGIYAGYKMTIPDPALVA